MKSNYLTPLIRTLAKLAPAALALLLGAPGTASASEIFNLDYWLAHAPTGTEADWTAKAGAGRESSIDDNGTGTGGYVGPGFGGQLYDAEAIYVELIGDVLNIAVVTGMPQGNPQRNNSYAPGDIAIDLGYQLNGPPSFEIGIVTASTDHGSMTAGQGYRVGDTTIDWDYGLWSDGSYTDEPAFVKNEHPTIMNKGTLVTDLVTDFYYGNAIYGSGSEATNYATTGNSLGQLDADNSGNDLHYLIAASLDLSELPNTVSIQGKTLVHWTMRCANDYIQVDPAPVPEPAPILLMLGGLLGLAGVRRLRNS